MTEIVARLIELRPGEAERVHELGLGAYVLGRDGGADVTLEHRDVSRRHAELSITSEGSSIRDLGSKNGVLVDGERCTSSALAPSAELSLGELRLRLEFLGTHVDRLLARNGELTVRRPRPVEVPLAEVGAEAGLEARTEPSMLLPLLATAVCLVALVALLVFG